MASPGKIFAEEETDLACPYFMPISKLESGNWMHPARLPLGGGWTGHCTAPGHEQAVPSQDVLETCCNMGYAGTCSWAPAEQRSDAVRFAVSSPARNAGPNSSGHNPARLVQLIYVCEQANRPAGHGELQFDLSTASWVRRHEDARIQKMAECFLESYLRRRS